MVFNKLIPDKLITLDDSSSKFASFINGIFVFAIIFLPINATLAGISESQAIKRHVKFNYVSSINYSENKFFNTNKVLIFLGKAGSKYIFINSRHTQHIIVDENQIPTLNYETYDISDAISKKTFENHNK
ncbi:hypothetical protein N008_00050 [Hymenobacter sp. APR13]|nr:hypothetical protein N008_00050 [Hymenobacter sp. APR13]